MSKAVLVGTGVYNVRDYGLIDDNSTDNSTAFTNLLAQMPTYGGSIYFPGGGAGYLFTSAITINKNVLIYGDGKEAYQFFTLTGSPLKGSTNIYCNSATIDLFTFTNNVGVNAYITFKIRDLSIINTAGSQPSAGCGIKLLNVTQHSTFDNICVRGFYNCVNVSSGMFWAMTNCDIVAPINTGLIIDNTVDPDAGGWHIISTNFVSGLIAGLSSQGVWIKGGGGGYFFGCFFNAQGNVALTKNFIYGIYSDFSTGATSDIHIINCFFENFQTNGIHLRNTSGGTVQNIQIIHCEIASVNTSGTVGAAIDISNFSHVTIIDVIATNFGSAISHPVLLLDTITTLRIGIINYQDYNAPYTLTSCTDVSVVLMTKDILAGGNLTFGAAATGKDLLVYNGGSTSTGSQLTLTPSPVATNLTAVLNMISRGNGGAQYVLSGTDRIADPVNFSYGLFTSNGTTSYDLATGGAGSTAAPPLRIYVAANIGQLTLATNGDISVIGNITGVLSLTGSSKIQGNYFLSIGAANIEGYRIYKDATPSKAVDFGMSVPGGTTGDDAIISTYTPTTWTERFRVKNTNGQIQFKAYGAGSITGTVTFLLGVDSAGNIVETSSGGATSASYTPALTNTTNITAATLLNASYTQIGNIVTAQISGTFNVTTANTISVLTFALPVTATTTSQQVGTATIYLSTGPGSCAGYAQVVSGTTGTITFYPGANVSANFGITIQYKTN